jgi:hypothetical protein
MCFSATQTSHAGSGTTFTHSISDYCRLDRIEANYSAARSSYKMRGTCYIDVASYGKTAISWESRDAYDAPDRRIQENITLTGNPPLPSKRLGDIKIRMFCNSDPWINAAVCGPQEPQISGDVSMVQVEGLLNQVTHIVMSKRYPLTADFAYDRNPLLAQRDTELRTEATSLAAADEARRKATQRLQQSATQKQMIVVPSIQIPTAGSLFFINTSVPIKIVPPTGMAATSYLVRLEFKNTQGNWALVTNLPVSAAEASSPAGYLGWGAPGNGRGAAMIAGPGTYRLSAQVSAPRQTGWSPAVEFVVTAPSKAIQRAPKAFGP